MIRRVWPLLMVSLGIGLWATAPALGSVEAARTFAQGMVEELGLEVTECSKKLLAKDTGEEHVCARTAMPFRKFSAAWDEAAPRRAPKGVKQFGRWTKTGGSDGQRQNYEVQGTPFQVAYAAERARNKSVRISYSDYSWNIHACVEGRYSGSDTVYDAESSGVAGGGLISSSQPEYPEFARVARLQASIELEALIDEQGTVRDVCVAKPANTKAGFEEAAIEAVKKWTYAPATQDGVPVRVFLTVKVDFKLH